MYSPCEFICVNEHSHRNKCIFKFDIIAISVMPDHLHMIIKVDSINDYPKIIYSMKYYFSKHIKIEKKVYLKVKLKKAKKVYGKEDIGSI